MYDDIIIVIFIEFWFIDEDFIILLFSYLLIFKDFNFYSINLFL